MKGPKCPAEKDQNVQGPILAQGPIWFWAKRPVCLYIAFPILLAVSVRIQIDYGENVVLFKED